ncbi:MAG: ROK family protein [Enterococcus sp.]
MQQTVLAIDLGGTKLLIGEIDQNGQILSQKSFTSNTSSQQAAYQQIIAAIQEFLATVPQKGELVGISLAVVGRVSEEKGIWFEIHPENAEPIELAKVLSNIFDLPCIINNDVTSATYAEQYLGIGRDTNDFIYLNIGTGIAARIVTGGHIVSGTSFNAGEIGHLVIDMTMERSCVCGRKGCVETFASGLGMSNQAIEWLPQHPESHLNQLYDSREKNRLSAQSIFSSAVSGDKLAQRVMEKASRGISELIMNLVRVSDTDAVILGGGVMNNDLFFHLVTQQLNQKTIRFVRNGIHRTTVDMNKITLIGAGLRGFKKLRKEEEANGAVCT